MAFSASNDYSLAEILNAYDQNGRLKDFIDVFSDHRPLLEDSHWQEANHDRSHEFEQIVSLPAARFMSIDEGYQKGKEVTRSVTEQLGSMGAMFEIGKKLCDSQSNPSGWRLSRTKLYIKGMLKNWTDLVYFASTADSPKNVDGLITRYSSKSKANVADFGGTANLRPMIIMSWGDDRLSFLYPKGGKTTFVENDQGLVQLSDSKGQPYPGYRSYFDFTYGIGVGDERYVRRCGGIDYTTIKTSTTFEHNLTAELAKMPDLENTSIHVGVDIWVGIMDLLRSKTNISFTTMNIWGQELPSFMGCPIILDNALDVTDSALAS